MVVYAALQGLAGLSGIQGVRGSMVQGLGLEVWCLRGLRVTMAS